MLKKNSGKEAQQERRAVMRAVRLVIRRLAHEVLENGEVQTSGRATGVVRSEVARLVLKRLMTPRGVTLPIDYRRTLLKTARQHTASSNPLLALVLYATYFEHHLNRLIAGGLVRQKFSTSDIGAVIRDASQRAKTGWLLRLLGIRLSQKHVSVIIRVMEKRNEYVHYKWKGISLSKSGMEVTAKERAANKALAAEADKVVMGLLRRAMKGRRRFVPKVEISYRAASHLIGILQRGHRLAAVVKDSGSVDDKTLDSQRLV
jgi:hypothetical protein